jgi:ABC-type phosphate transport system permease subunit
VKHKMNKWLKLGICILVDILSAIPTIVVALSIFILPFEVFTFVVSTIYAAIMGAATSLIVFLMFRKPLASVANFAESMFPGIDLLPTATLTWLYCWYKGEL